MSRKWKWINHRRQQSHGTRTPDEQNKNQEKLTNALPTEHNITMLQVREFCRFIDRKFTKRIEWFRYHFYFCSNNKKFLNIITIFRAIILHGCWIHYAGGSSPFRSIRCSLVNSAFSFLDPIHLERGRPIGRVLVTSRWRAWGHNISPLPRFEIVSVGRRKLLNIIWFFYTNTLLCLMGLIYPKEISVILAS